MQVVVITLASETIAQNLNAMTSSTHQVLSCADLVNLICGQCDNATLISLACTKRDISEITLDVLWRSIPDIGPLIRCMPEDLWEEQKVSEEDIKLVITLLPCIRTLLFTGQADIPKINPSN